MSRIRSIHPGIFTDEAFASLTMPTRVLLFGIWTECWDDGIFEWKPITLKMRLFPADNIDISSLLAEALAANVICKFEHNGRFYGAVRNFCRFQRPKKPNSSGLMSEEIADFVKYVPPKQGDSSEPDTHSYTDSTDTSSEPVRNRFGTGSEITKQMEDGGCNKEETGKPVSKKRANTSAYLESEFERFWEAWPNKVAKPAARKAFKKVCTETDAIIAGIPRYVATKRPDCLWLNPATYLNQRRWEDSPAPLLAVGTATSKVRGVDVAASLLQSIETRKLEANGHDHSLDQFVLPEPEDLGPFGTGSRLAVG